MKPKSIAQRNADHANVTGWASTIVVAVLGIAAPAEASRWTIDPEASEIVATTEKAGFLSFAGHDHVIVADRFGGTIEFDSAEPDRASIEVVIEAASMRVADEDKPEDVPKVQKEMETSVLEVEEYPEIAFRSSAIDVKKSDETGHELEVRGILRLHGQSRVVKLDVRLVNVAHDDDSPDGTAGAGPKPDGTPDSGPAGASGGDHLPREAVQLTAETVIKQTAYGIEPVSVGLGAVKVKDEVKLSFRLVGVPSDTR